MIKGNVDPDSICFLLMPFAASSSSYLVLVDAISHFQPLRDKSIFAKTLESRLTMRFRSEAWRFPSNHVPDILLVRFAIRLARTPVFAKPASALLELLELNSRLLSVGRLRKAALARAE